MPKGGKKRPWWLPWIPAFIIAFAITVIAIIYFSPGAWDNVRVTDSSGNALTPDLASIKNPISGTSTNYGVVWTDNRDGEEPQVYFALLDSEGNKLGSDLRISATSTMVASDPQVIWDNDEHQFVAVWSERSASQSENETNGCDIYYAHITAYEPAVVIKRNRVTNDKYGICPSNPKIITRKGSYNRTIYVIFWNENREGAEDMRIYMKEMSGWGSWGSVKEVTDVKSSLVEISKNFWGVRTLVWNELNPDNSIKQVRFSTVRIDPYGNVIRNDVPFNPFNSSSTIMKGWDLVWNEVSYNDNSGIFLEVLDENNIEQQYLVELMPDGSVATGSPAKITNNNLASKMLPGDATFNTDKYGVSLTKRGKSIYFTEIGLWGQLASSSIRISDWNLFSKISHPSIAWGESEYGIVWQDSRDGKSEIYFATGLLDE